VTHPPTVEQLRNLAGRTFAGQLRPEESARLLEGIELLAARKPPRRPSKPLAAAKRIQRLKQALYELHAPMWRGGVEICSECSGWDGFRCRGVVTPFPCPTVDVVDVQRRRSGSEGARAGTKGPQGAQGPVNGARGVRGAARPPQGPVGEPRGRAA
jgi:hypothetical protein